MTDVQQICELLVSSQLMTDDHADQQLASWCETGTAADDARGEEFLDWLVEQNMLTEFQSEALAAGHTGPFMLGPYRVHEQIASGRLAGLFRAVHVEYDQPVSLKIFPSSISQDEEKEGRMTRELRVAVEVQHPHVIRSYQLGRIGKTYYLAMENLEGENVGFSA